jgi:hypothetical protein
LIEVQVFWGGGIVLFLPASLACIRVGYDDMAERALFVFVFLFFYGRTFSTTGIIISPHTKLNAWSMRAD